MKINVSKSSPVPVSVQIKERIMIALSLGELKPGDALPSIRELESELGVGRAIIRRAYVELKKQGILDMQQGRRISIREDILSAVEDRESTRQLNSLVEQTVQKARKLNLNPVLFGRYLLSYAVEEDRINSQFLCAESSMGTASERAKEISQLWSVHVAPVVIGDLRRTLTANGSQARHIFTTYHRLDETNAEIERAGCKGVVQTIPIRVNFKASMRDKVASLPRGAKVLLLGNPADVTKNGHPFADAYKEAFAGCEITFQLRTVATETQVLNAATSGKFSLVIVNTHQWEKLSEATRRHARVIRPEFELDKKSLEVARVKAGILAISLHGQTASVGTLARSN